MLGLLNAGEESLSFDEGVSYWSADRKPWGDVFTDEPNIAFYYGLLRLASDVIGTSELALRLPSAVFAAASIPVVAAIGARVYGPRVALVAAALLATSASLVQYAQDARTYTLALFLASLSTLLFMRALDPGVNGSGRWIAWAAVSAAAFYAHLFTAFLLAAQALALAFHPRRPRGRTLITAAGLFAVLVAPLAAVMSLDDLSRFQGLPPTTWSGVREAIEALSGGPILGWALLAIGLGGLVATVVERRRGATRPETWQLVLIAGWLVLPIVLLVLASVARPTFQSRYLLYVLPALMLLAAAALSRVRPLPLLPVVLGAVLAVSAVRIGDHYDDPKEADWRSAARIVADAARPGDAVLLAGYAYPNFDYYYDPEFDPALTPILYPEGLGADAIAGRRVWLVTFLTFGDPPDQGSAERLAADARTRSAVARGHEVRVELWEPDRTVAAGRDEGA